MDLTLRAMRGTDTKQSSMLALMSPDSVVPSKHPLRRVKVLADRLLMKLSPTFDAMYSAIGRPSIPPERLLKSMVLMALYETRDYENKFIRPQLQLPPRELTGNR
jgi:hypothetical protein